jgi:4-methylaminobutanoate oxidase (formaldehyde-forming)
MATLPPGRERAVRIGGDQLRVLRCPSTGDWHLLVAPELALGLYDRLVAEGLDLGIRDAGEQAADALRIGRGLPAWGTDVGPTVIAIEAGLADGRHAKSAGFIGGEALARLGRTAPRRRLDAFALSREPRVPLEGGEPIWSDGRCVGFVSSAAFVVAFDRWVVLAVVDVTSGDGAHRIDAAGELVGLENYVPSRHLEAPA